MTTTQMQAIASPATGDLVYNTTGGTFYYYTGSFWSPLAGSGWSLTGDAGTSASTNFLGTKDSVDLVQRTNNHERARVLSNGDVALTNTTNKAGSLIFYEPSGSGTLYSSFQAGNQDSTIHYILPPTDGISGQALDDSLGTLGWKTFGTVGGGFGDTLWKRGSGTASLYSLGTLNRTNGKWSIASTENCSGGSEASSVFGDSNSSSAKYGCVTGGSNNSVSGNGGSVVRGGAWNSSGSQNTMIVGGLANQASGQDCVILGGDSNHTSGDNSIIINGADNTFASNNNLVFGYNAHPTGSNQLIFYPPTSTAIRTGIQNTSPAEAMDVTGNVRLSQALVPNGLSGSAGLTLKSAGTGSPPTWGTVSIPTTSNWSTLGNSGSSPPTTYIGTTDSMAFVIRTNATERARIRSTGFVGVGTTTPVHQLHIVSTSTTDETAAAFGGSTGTTSSESVGVWGRADNTSSSNTGTIAVLATGNGATSAGSTNVALQISQAEFAMGRTSQNPSPGTATDAAASGAAYSQEGPSGVIQLSMGNDLTTLPPTAGVFQDLGNVTINNRYITSSSIILVGVVDKINGGGNPDPRNSIYRVDVESRASGSCTLRVSMIPFVSDTHVYPASNYIRIGYIVINPGR
ncbi:MAG: hypothetical protein Q8922_03520 [Bacteroidota bacterium]|nr:hypothetical protein [Bacteroidota bacterium]MDP4233361.1 hypothetical protein [Bacteroidota bacterium]MDP4242227.1 hypothetical protein [Bacteroidota bacterium]MDP4286983.1 hypothetical protein [Bacteroidota bacterium]